LSNPLQQLRAICLALPDTTEVESWGAPTFRVKGKIFAMYARPESHTGAGRHGLWLMASPGNQGPMVKDRPDRFFVPPYVGPSGWIGVYLDKRPSWKEVKLLVAEAHALRSAKPKKKGAK
jgi:predicted DNA-binding protein (MmcQ/YjbR family)